jgi:NAD(P)-dependent dehydrogenase (short-subunit alcohol dehydrogenase family)
VARRTRLLDEFADEIEQRQGPRPLLITQDIMASDAATRLRDAALAGLGHVGILVNCDGGSRPLPLDAPEEKWEEAITLNFTRQRQITHALLPQMIERCWGRIINITGKSEPDRLNAAFAAKAAMHAWAKGLSRDVGKYGITVNSIPPGRIMSEQIRRNYPRSIARGTLPPRSRPALMASQRTSPCWRSFSPRRPRTTSAGRSFRWMEACGAMRSKPIGHRVRRNMLPKARLRNLGRPAASVPSRAVANRRAVE